MEDSLHSYEDYMAKRAVRLPVTLGLHRVQGTELSDGKESAERFRPSGTEQVLSSLPKHTLHRETR